MPLNKRAIGAKGENLAADHLTNSGFEILHQNWRYGKMGEFDIIALDPDGLTTVFVEVKKAGGNSFGSPESWVDKRKQSRLYRLGQAYMKQKNLYKLKSRFDVITITWLNGEQKIRHLKNAFIKY